MSKRGKPHNPRCPYCGAHAALVTGEKVYPARRDLWHKKFWRCAPCDAHVGVHPGTVRPLGRLADRTLRKLKMAAHAAFDPLWRNGAMTRHEAYRRLAAALEIPAAKCHIGYFDAVQCEAVARLAPTLLQEVPDGPQ